MSGNHSLCKLVTKKKTEPNCCSASADSLTPAMQLEVKMTLRVAGWTIAAIGLILLVISLTADITGLGDDEGAFDIGVQQGSGIALGLILIVVGVVLVRRKHSNGT